ncbi:MAG: cupin [Brevinematales bacterium]|nr:cupin [Brevinematales bacterium]
MPKHIKEPSFIQAAGNMTKLISEYVGKANSGNTGVSIALMKSPEGWEEPGQTPEFTEYSVVLKGILRAECDDGEYEIAAGQAFSIGPDEWVRYSTPQPGGAEYIAVCIPAFSPETVHRDES